MLLDFFVVGELVDAERLSFDAAKAGPPIVAQIALITKFPDDGATSV